MKIHRLSLCLLFAASLIGNRASAQSISNILIPPQTVLANLQGASSGASAVRFCDFALALSQTGYLITSAPLTCGTVVPLTLTPGNAIVFGAAPNQNAVVDAGGPPVLAGGTPSSLILTNATGLPIATGIAGLGTGVAAWAAVPSSANLRTAITDETGSGALYFQGGDLGTPSVGVGTNLTALNASNLSAGTVAVARGGVDQAAFTTWSPTISCGTGTITTLGTVVARYKQVGKIVFFYLSAPITTNGTCASSIQATLPFATANTANQNGIGREDGVSGKTLAARIANNSTSLVVTNYDNTYLGPTAR